MKLRKKIKRKKMQINRMETLYINGIKSLITSVYFIFIYNHKKRSKWNQLYAIANWTTAIHDPSRRSLMKPYSRAWLDNDRNIRLLCTPHTELAEARRLDRTTYPAFDQFITES